MANSSMSASMASNDKNKHFDYLFNISEVGDSNVGKSSLMLRFTDDTFDDIAISTCGVDYRSRTIDFPEHGKVVKLKIQDMAGQERYRSIRSSFYRGVHGLIIVYAINSRVSFDSLKSYWLPELKRELADPDIPKILVGNKCDINSSDRQVTAEEGQAYARTLGAQFVETSAREGTEVNRMFLDLAHTIYQAHRQASLTNVGELKAAPDMDGKRSSLFEDIDDLMPVIQITPIVAPPKQTGCCK
jgi:Ras-related protein Rab-1A